MNKWEQKFYKQRKAQDVQHSKTDFTKNNNNNNNK